MTYGYNTLLFCFNEIHAKCIERRNEIFDDFLFWNYIYFILTCKQNDYYIIAMLKRSQPSIVCPTTGSFCNLLKIEAHNLDPHQK